MRASPPCLPEFFTWLQVFDDLPLATVFAAHAIADSSLTERECVRRTRLNRETVHKKKQELIETHRVLRPQEGVSGRGWRGLPCTVDWEQLQQLVENSSNGWKTSHQLSENQPSMAGKPTIETGAMAGKPAIELSENQPSMAGKPTIESPVHKERAPAPASRSIDFDFDLKQSIEGLSHAQKTDFDPNVFEAARQAIHSYHVKWAREENRLPKGPDDQLVAEFLAVAEWPRLHAMLLDLAAESKEAGYSYGWFVTVALQRLRGVSPKAVREARKELAANRKPSLPDRKPPEKEEPSFDIHAQLKAAAAKMGGTR